MSRHVEAEAWKLAPGEDVASEKKLSGPLEEVPWPPLQGPREGSGRHSGQDNLRAGAAAVGK